MGLGTFLSDKIFGDPELERQRERDALLKQQRREDNAQQLFNDLISKGYQPDVSKEASANFLKTGQVDIPKYQTKNLPPSNMFPEGIPARELTKPAGKGLFTFDQGTGKFNREDLPADVNEPSVHTFNSTPDNGENIYTKGGEVVNREPNGTKTTKVINLDARGSAQKDPVRQALALKEIQDFQSDINNGIPIEPDRMARVKSAADYVGNVDVGQEPDTSETTEPGRVAKFFGAEPVTTTTPGQPFVKYGQTKEIPTPAAKKLTREKAKQFLDQYGGNKDKARQAAKQAGYEF